MYFLVAMVAMDITYVRVPSIAFSYSPGFCFFSRTASLSRKTTDKGKGIHASSAAAQGTFVTPPAKSSNVLGKPWYHAYETSVGASPRIRTPGSTRSESVGNLTPEQLQNLLRDFDENFDAINGARAEITSERTLTAGISPASSTTPSRYRPSAVQKGTSVTPLRADGRVTQSSLSQRLQVMESLGVSRAGLEHAIDNLREWFAENLLHSLQRNLADAHLDVIQFADTLGIASGFRLTALKDLSNDRSQIADDESAISQLAAKTEDYLRQPQYAQHPGLLSCQRAIRKYQHLKLLLFGKYPAGFLQSTQNGYILQRINDLSRGTCIMDYKWNGGGDWNGKSWSNELPTDSSLLLYLFAAFVLAPGWDFGEDDANHLEGPGGVLYLGQVPPRAVNQFFGILTTRPPQKTEVCIEALIRRLSK